MRKRSKISVIVPVYNVEKYLSKCVESILNQTYKDIELILVDDGSLDNSGNICDNYAKNDNRIKVIHKENGGLSSARNAGLDIASGEYISFVDSDDWIDENTYEELVKKIVTTNADIICFAGEKTDGTSVYERCFDCKGDGVILNGRDVVKEILLDKIGSQVVKGLYHAKCWKDLKFPVGRLYEDIPVTYKAFEKAERVAFVYKPFYKYRINPNSISHKPKPITSYHIFLGYKDHFEHAKIYYPDISKQSCSLAAQFAISAYFHYCTDGKDDLQLYVNEICEFLYENKERLDFKAIIKSRKYALKLFYFSKPIFNMVFKVLYKLGFCKSIGLNVKK